MPSSISRGPRRNNGPVAPGKLQGDRQIPIVPAYTHTLGRQPMFRQPLFRQPLFRQPLFRQPLFRQSVDGGSGWVGSWFLAGSGRVNRNGSDVLELGYSSGNLRKQQPDAIVPMISGVVAVGQKGGRGRGRCKFLTKFQGKLQISDKDYCCLLYTSDAADE